MTRIITLGSADYNIQYGDWTGFSNVTSIRKSADSCGTSPRLMSSIPSTDISFLWQSVYTSSLSLIRSCSMNATQQIQSSLHNTSLVNICCWKPSSHWLSVSLAHLNVTSLIWCATFAYNNIIQMEVGLTQIDLRAIAIVLVASTHMDTNTDEFPQ
jgi:hypothetical protein